MLDVLFSSKRHDWETPQKLFDELDAEFHFTLDPCATAITAKCEKYFTPAEDGLVQTWGGRQSSAIRLTGGSSQSGYKNATRKAGTQKS